MSEWITVIGLEVHAQILSKSKLFSRSPVRFGGEPNTVVSPFDAALPGTLPVLNKHCIHQALKAGIALSGSVNRTSLFERKHYFYPDLPSGFQISQLKIPLISGGNVHIHLKDYEKDITLDRLHVEQDAGKSLHDQHPTETYIDLNRAGVALMEIVSNPDISSAEEAVAYVHGLRTLLMAIGVCDGNMAEGSMRVDINLSMHHKGQPYGTRTETKNINSFRSLKQVIEFEQERQVHVLTNGGTVFQETRSFDTNTGKTKSLRKKESGLDYRYFPDPNIHPLVITDDDLKRCTESLPVLPEARALQYQQDWGLSMGDANQLVSNYGMADYFDQVVDVCKDGKRSFNWIFVELLGRLHASNKHFKDNTVSAESLGTLVSYIIQGKISGKIAKDILDEMFSSGKNPTLIIQEKGLQQVSDTGVLESSIQQVLSNNPEQLEKLKNNSKLLGWFVGQAIKETKGQGNPALISELLKKILETSYNIKL